MSVLLVTIFLSLCLAGLFMVFYWIEHRQREGGSFEQDALLPFSDEDDHPASGNQSRDGRPPDSQNHN